MTVKPILCLLLLALLPVAESSECIRILVGSSHRTGELTVPFGDAADARPLMIVLHGGTGNGAGMRNITDGGFDRIAQREGPLVCYPDALDGHWNDDRGAAGAKPGAVLADDVAFIRALIQEMVRTRRADPRRVYVTGISNGAIFCYRLARELGSQIAAIAPVCGLLPSGSRGDVWPVAVPTLLIVGTADPLMPIAGGSVGGRLARGEVCSLEGTLAALKVWNRCAGEPILQPPVEALPDDGTKMESSMWFAKGDREMPSLQMLRIVGGGHTWPGGRQYLRERLIGRTSHAGDASELIWAFCRRHASVP